MTCVPCAFTVLARNPEQDTGDTVRIIAAEGSSEIQEKMVQYFIVRTGKSSVIGEQVLGMDIHHLTVYRHIYIHYFISSL